MEKFTGRPAKDGHTKLRNKVIEVIEFRIERYAKQIPFIHSVEHVFSTHSYSYIQVPQSFLQSGTRKCVLVRYVFHNSACAFHKHRVQS